MEFKGIRVYLFIEKDGCDIIENINEFSEYFDIEGFYFYKYYNYGIFDWLNFSLKYYFWFYLVKNGISLVKDINFNFFLLVWMESI